MCSGVQRRVERAREKNRTKLSFLLVLETSSVYGWQVALDRPEELTR